MINPPVVHCLYVIDGVRCIHTHLRFVIFRFFYFLNKTKRKNAHTEIVRISLLSHHRLMDCFSTVKMIQSY